MSTIFKLLNYSIFNFVNNIRNITRNERHLHIRMFENTIIRVKGTSIITRYNENIYYVVLMMSLGSRHSNCPNSVYEARRETTRLETGKPK